MAKSNDIVSKQRFIAHLPAACRPLVKFACLECLPERTECRWCFARRSDCCRPAPTGLETRSIPQSSESFLPHKRCFPQQARNCSASTTGRHRDERRLAPKWSARSRALQRGPCHSFRRISKRCLGPTALCSNRTPRTATPVRTYLAALAPPNRAATRLRTLPCPLAC